MAMATAIAIAELRRWLERVEAHGRLAISYPPSIAICVAVWCRDDRQSDVQ